MRPMSNPCPLPGGQKEGKEVVYQQEEAEDHSGRNQNGGYKNREKENKNFNLIMGKPHKIAPENR